MIKESLYFTFNGRNSTDFGIINVSIGSTGLYEESFMSSRSIVEQKVNGNPKPFLYRVDREPLTIPLSFYFEDTWNDELIDEICDWLDVDYYQQLGFDQNFDRIFYAMPVNDTSLIHNGLKQGYLTLNMRCNSPYAYSRVLEDGFDFTQNNGVNTFSIDNIGRLEIKPVIEISKVGDGSITIRNFSKAYSDFILTDLLDGEVVTIDCEKKYIDSSIVESRYDNFNQNYLSLPFGVNNLQVTGSCILVIRYQYTYRALTL